ncbi:hypothetical protein EBY67_04385 [bacterium]|nr:hypothetical protein [bacterium]
MSPQARADYPTPHATPSPEPPPPPSPSDPTTILATHPCPDGAASVARTKLKLESPPTLPLPKSKSDFFSQP